MDSTDPRHGTLRGYSAGCRAKSATPCPAEPSCSKVHNAHHLQYRRRPNDAPHQAQSKHVQKRLRETIEAAGLAAVCEHTGLSERAIESYNVIESPTMRNEEAIVLDRAWSFLVHGKDTQAPDFPHGDVSRGYSGGYCRCSPCRDSARIARKRTSNGLVAPRSRLRDPAALAALRAHVTALVAASTTAQVARAAGVEFATVRAAENGEQLQYGSATKLRRTTMADVDAVAMDYTSIPADETVRLINTMRALGYSAVWQARQLGLHERGVLQQVRLGGQVSVKNARLVAELARKVGERPASLEDGIPAHIAAQTARKARAAGFYPPSCYDDDGTLNTRLIPDHPHARLDAVSEQRLTALMQVTRGMTMKEAAAAAGADKDSMWRRMRHGLVFEQAEGNRIVLNYAASRARVREIHDVHADVLGGRIGVVTATILLGIHDPSLLTVRAQSRYGPHPEVVAWHEMTTHAA